MLAETRAETAAYDCGTITA